MRLGVRVGQECENAHNRNMRDLQVNLIELDEQWDFIRKKQKRVKTCDSGEFGNVWLFVALASMQKAVAKRAAENTRELAMDLRARIQMWSVTPSSIAGLHRSASSARQKL